MPLKIKGHGWCGKGVTSHNLLHLSCLHVLRRKFFDKLTTASRNCPRKNPINFDAWRTYVALQSASGICNLQHCDSTELKLMAGYYQLHLTPFPGYGETASLSYKPFFCRSNLTKEYPAASYKFLGTKIIIFYFVLD